MELDRDWVEASSAALSWRDALADVRAVLAAWGFAADAGNLYCGDETADAIRCVLAVQELASRFAWFEGSVRTLRMLRIEETGDLMIALNGKKRHG